MDLVDWTLNRLSTDHRWQIVDFLMLHGVNYCRASAVCWSFDLDSDSIFDLSECNYCKNSDYIAAKNGLWDGAYYERP